MTQVRGGTPTTLVFVAPWECSPGVAPLPREPRDAVVVCLVRARAEERMMPWHRRRHVLVRSAAVHFAEELRAAGWRVVERDAERVRDGLRDAVAGTGATRVVATVPREWDLRAEFAALAPEWRARGIALSFAEDRSFLATRAEFAEWAEGRKELRMELFYRTMRRKWGVLLEPDGTPVGGVWNFDADNRKSWPKGRAHPTPWRAEPTPVVRRMIAEADAMPQLWGEAEGFDLPVTRADAVAWLDRFLDERLPEFGPYEDAMRAGEPDLLHSTLASMMNVGLLHPLEIVRGAEARFRAGRAPLASTEGFIRQVLGWREYVRGIYRHLMPGFRTVNALGGTRALPLWYWDPDGAGGYEGEAPPPCRMRCLADSARLVRAHGRVHHIHRLMVLSNFATLAGVRPHELSRWFWAGFTDAWEWVELPNVMGMATWGDGGVMASKPYVASGAYVDRMSDYCGACAFDVKRRSGPGACPMNLLYWDFLARHRERFAEHPRMAMMIRNLDRIPGAELAAIRREAAAFLEAVPWDADRPVAGAAPA